MAETPTGLTVSRDGEVVIVEFLDRNILDEAYIQKIGDELDRFIDQSANPKLVLNFKNVDHLSSAALGMLITRRNKISNKDGMLRLAAISDQIVEVFKITKLDKLFHICPTVQEARTEMGR